MSTRQRRRSVASCSECYLRKQKCDRSYPCSNCSRRRRPEICSYAASNPPRQTPSTALKSRAIAQPSTLPGNNGRAAQVELTSVAGPAPEDGHQEKSMRRDIAIDHTRFLDPSGNLLVPSTPRLDSPTPDSSVSFHLGYADSSNENLAGLMKNFGLLDLHEPSNIAFERLQPNYLKLVKDNLPGRATIDTLVEIFFQEANWMYEAIYPTTFLGQYENWWQSSPEHQIEDVVFATLLMRICCYTTQFLPSTTYTAATIAGEPLSNIRTKCYNTATTLTSLLKSVGAPPSHQQVLQLFYAACYAKNEAHVKDAWDLLGEAIQISVDLGMHEEQVARKDLPEFELDMRRRTFWNLYIWDRFMSAVLDRWPRILEERCTVSYPMMHLSQSLALLGAPDEFLERILQVQLARIWFDNGTSHGGAQGYDKHIVEAKHLRLQKEFVLILPPVFLLENADTQWDDLIPSMKKRRQILHLTIYAMLSNLHRPVLLLTRKELENLSVNERKMTYQHRIRFLNYTLELLPSVLRLHNLLGGSQHRLFIISFYIFEASMQLGMHLLGLSSIEDLYACYHDPSALSSEQTLPSGVCNWPKDPWKKALCLREMSEALQRLSLLAEVSPIARLGANKLAEMISKVNLHYCEATPNSNSYGEDNAKETVINNAAAASVEVPPEKTQMSLADLDTFDFMAAREWPSGLEEEIWDQGLISQLDRIFTPPQFFEGIPDFIPTSTMMDTQDLNAFLASPDQARN